MAEEVYPTIHIDPDQWYIGVMSGHKYMYDPDKLADPTMKA